jgi:hypothetical protein
MARRRHCVAADDRKRLSTSPSDVHLFNSDVSGEVAPLV